MSVSAFMDHNFRHFNARETRDAARGWKAHLEKGGKMFLAMGGAMSTAELGLTLAEMIRQDKIHAVSCSANNLEEDIYNLVAHDFYKMLPGYRDLTAKEEKQLYNDKFNRVTDTCIPEDEAFRRIESVLIPLWKKAAEEKKSYFPYEYIYELIRTGALEKFYQIDPKDSWVVAACEKNIPIFTPGFEDCTTGNIFVACVMAGDVNSIGVIKGAF